ncbi:hypothetical protein QTG54_014384, partial [Skeletonema marinoi]
MFHCSIKPAVFPLNTSETKSSFGMTGDGRLFQM